MMMWHRDNRRFRPVTLPVARTSAVQKLRLCVMSFTRTSHGGIMMAASVNKTFEIYTLIQREPSRQARTATASPAKAFDPRPPRSSQRKGNTMSLSDVLKGAFGNAVGQAEQAALPDIMKSVLGTEGVQAILAKLKDAGFDSQVSSWLDKNKDNLPISADQIRTALGDEHVQQLAKSLGIPLDTILAGLADKLPEIANAAGPAAAPDPKAP